MSAPQTDTSNSLHEIPPSPPPPRALFLSRARTNTHTHNSLLGDLPAVEVRLPLNVARLGALSAAPAHAENHDIRRAQKVRGAGSIFAGVSFF